MAIRKRARKSCGGETLVKMRNFVFPGPENPAGANLRALRGILGSMGKLQESRSGGPSVNSPQSVDSSGVGDYKVSRSNTQVHG